ncbi:hypothetical protein C453_04024 [Haloferax elongans ATCC BAA-1513]|uniref:Uncharacterized protein n=1 Tax=Haloferax elongans ATCC BAA-1513 TaxID=1230453 RepID=M0HWK5_HALEO|nr:hypothetical protein [Haloferax elongans]ELZ87489.1 hypothetical protein C453_04024 [Haloferax elongans ATCC BAA-1513]
MTVVSPQSSGGAIYTDGERLQIDTAAGESVTVPTGEKWYITSCLFAQTTNYETNMTINGTSVSATSSRNLDSVPELEGSWLYEGDKLTEGSNPGIMLIRGWRL